MSETEEAVDASQAAVKVFANPDEFGTFPAETCEHITGPGGSLLLVEQGQGWHAGFTANLPEVGMDDLPINRTRPLASRGDAIRAACDMLIAFCSNQKDSGNTKLRKAAQKLQDWALDQDQLAQSDIVACLAGMARPLPDLPDDFGQLELGRTEPGRTELLPELHASAIGDEIRMLPVSQLRESERNPRKYFAEKPLKELAESMRIGGFWKWSPIMARPVADGLAEIGAGHRRFRAAQLAGLTEVPVVLREMTDAQFLRVLTFDNSNREDPHPLDEAAGFRFYLTETACKVADIAAEIGQSVEYVYQRLKYADLIEPAQKAFWDGRISAGAAILVARLQPNEQARALAAWLERRVDSVREFARWIETHVYLDVRKACFNSDSEDLLPGAPSCSVCPKRVGNAAELFADVKHQDTCTDPTCFHRKEDAHVQLQIAKRNTDPDPKAAPLVKIETVHRGYQEKSPAGVLARDEYKVIEKKTERCESAREAIVVEGDKGQKKWICSDKKCKKHFGRSQFARSPQELAAERKRVETQRREEQTRIRTRDAIVAKAVWPLGQKELLIIVQSTLRRMWHDLLVKVIKTYEIEPVIKKNSYGATSRDYTGPMMAYVAGLDAEDLARVAIDLALWQDAEGQDAAVKDFGVDVKAIEKTVAASASEKKAPAKAAEGGTRREVPPAAKTPEPAKGDTRKDVIGKLATLTPEPAKKAAPPPAKPAPAKKAPAKKKAAAPAKKAPPKPAAKKAPAKPKPAAKKKAAKK